MNNQKTIKKEVGINGIGLHTGRKVSVTLRPAPANTGIVFRRTDLNPAPSIKATPENILQSDKSLQRTSIAKDGVEVHTIEHLMAAFSGLAIDNVIADIEGMELPGLDGSVGGFARPIVDAGIALQNAPKKYIEIKEPVKYEKSKSSIEIYPDSRFLIEYHLEFEQPWLENQVFSLSVESNDDFAEAFINEIALSRTFCLEEEAAMLLKAGLGKGANLENTLVMGRNGPINNKLRFPDELARHKTLDLLGDLYILGGHIRGRVVARRSGHSLNAVLVKELSKETAAGCKP